MSIDPVSAIGPSPEPKPQPAAIRRPQPPPEAANPISPRPNVAHVSNRRGPVPSSDSPPAEALQDEVQVQRGRETDGKIVIKYLDHSGNLILQIPSSQVLGLARAIDQALDEQQKSRASDGASSAQGAKPNGH